MFLSISNHFKYFYLNFYFKENIFVYLIFILKMKVVCLGTEMLVILIKYRKVYFYF